MFSAVLLGLSLGSASACAEETPPFDLRYETERLRIGVSGDGELCGGDLVRFEQHLTRVEDLLSTEMDGKVDVYLWRDDSQGYKDYCGDYPGCYQVQTQTIYTSQYSLWHELVHAVAIPLGDPSPMWSEGIAKALDIRRTVPGTIDPVDNFYLDGDEVNYDSAGHFVRWIWEAHGPEAMHDILTDPRDLETAFEAIIGSTVEDARTQYLAEAPWSYAALESCMFADLEQAESGQWQEAIELDCENDQTLSDPSGLGTLRAFQVDAQSDFRIASDANRLVIHRCPDENIAARPEEEPGPEQGDVPISSPSAPEGPSRVVDTNGDGEVLNLAPARYELIILSEQARTVNIEITDLAPP